MSVAEGDLAPSFEMPATGGRTVASAALKGKPYVLYFYPKADTPGCTKEACAFQEALRRLADAGALAEDEATALIRADRLWRTVQGMLRITLGQAHPEAQLPEASARPLLRAVLPLLGRLDAAGLHASLERTAEQVRAIFVRRIGEIVT